jgi:hypothetical protein
MGSLYQLFLAGMNQTNKPVGALLFFRSHRLRKNTSG